MRSFLKLIQPGLLLLVLSAGSLWAEVASGQDLKTYLRILISKPGSSDAQEAQEYAIAHGEAGADEYDETLATTSKAYERVKAKGMPYQQAALLGVLLGLGDTRFVSDAPGLLLNGEDKIRIRLLQPLTGLEPILPIHQVLPEVVVKSGPDARALAQEIHTTWAQELQGSGVVTLFVLLGITFLGAVAYGVSLTSGMDKVMNTIVKWTNEPLERPAILKKIHGTVEPVVPQLLPYLNKRMSPAETAGLLDLLSNLEHPEVGPSLKKFASAKSDLVKQAAIVGMARLRGPYWDQYLIELLETGDEIQSAAAARTLGERKTHEALPKIQAMYEKAVGAQKEAYRDALERLAPNN